MESLSEFFQKITANREPSNLYTPIDYTMSQGGKRLRPRLVLMSAELFGGNTELAMYPAAAFEMLHNFTLIHDDIMDNAPIRRGKPTVYQQWNSNIAILSGDALAAIALQIMLNTPTRPEIALELSKLLAQTSVEVCEGQQKDLDFETADAVNIDEYLQMIHLKTAVMLAGCLKAGAIISDTSRHNQETIYRLGVHIGLAFQLKDDLLDVYGDPSSFGKKIGGDIRENKKTYLYLRALEEATPTLRTELLHYFSSTQFDDTEKFNAVKNIYEKLSIREKTAAAIDEYARLAYEDLEQLQEVSENKIPDFKNLIVELSQRNK